MGQLNKITDAVLCEQGLSLPLKAYSPEDAGPRIAQGHPTKVGSEKCGITLPCAPDILNKLCYQVTGKSCTKYERIIDMMKVTYFCQRVTQPRV